MIILLIIPIPKSTTNIHIHHFKPTFICPRSNAGVPFDLSGASGLHYYCAPLVCVPAVIGLLAVWQHNKPKTKNHFSSYLRYHHHHQGRHRCWVWKPGSNFEPVNFLLRCFRHYSPLVQWDCNRYNVTNVLKSCCNERFKLQALLWVL